jgi:hypothetical protein
MQDRRSLLGAPATVGGHQHLVDGIVVGTYKVGKSVGGRLVRCPQIGNEARRPVASISFGRPRIDRDCGT